MSSSRVLYALTYSLNLRQRAGVIRQNPLCGDSIALSVRLVPPLRCGMRIDDTDRPDFGLENSILVKYCEKPE